MSLYSINYIRSIFFSLALCLLFFLDGCTDKKHSPDVCGTWKGKKSSDIFSTGTGNIGLIFNKDGSFSSLVNGLLSPIETSGQITKWECDESKNPHWMDLILIDTASGEEILRMKGIYKYDDDAKKIMELYFNGRMRTANKNCLIRPTSIDQENELILNKE